jgi:hypothetical protein
MTEVQGGLRGKENWDRSSGNKNLFAREHQQTLRVIEDSQYNSLKVAQIGSLPNHVLEDNIYAPK